MGYTGGSESHGHSPFAFHRWGNDVDLVEEDDKVTTFDRPLYVRAA